MKRKLKDFAPLIFLTIIFVALGGLLIKSGYNKLQMTLKDFETLSGEVATIGIHTVGKNKKEKLLLQFKNSNLIFGFYRTSGNYADFMSKVNVGTEVIIYYDGSNNRDQILDLVHVERGGEVLYAQSEYNKEHWLTIALGLILVGTLSLFWIYWWKTSAKRMQKRKVRQEKNSRVDSVYTDYRQQLPVVTDRRFLSQPSYEKKLSIVIKPEHLRAMVLTIFDELAWEIALGEYDLYNPVPGQRFIIPDFWSNEDESGWTIEYPEIEIDFLAFRYNDENIALEAISVTYENNILHLKSVSEPKFTRFSDKGNNYFNVKLFSFALQKLIGEATHEWYDMAAGQFNEELKWTHYEVPEALPPPPAEIPPKAPLFYFGSAILAGGLGYLFGSLEYSGMSLPFLSETFFGFLVGYGTFSLMKPTGFLSNYRKNLFGIIGLSVILKSYLLFAFIHPDNGLTLHGYFNYLNALLEQGFMLFSFDSGSIGLLIFWILKFGVIYLVGRITLFVRRSNLLDELTPKEVMAYYFYLVISGKSKAEVQSAFTNKGWQKHKLLEGQLFDLYS